MIPVLPAPKLNPPVLPNILVGGAWTLALPPNPPKLGVALLFVLFEPNAGVDAPNEKPPLLDCPNPLLVAGAVPVAAPKGLLEPPNEGEAGDGCGEPTFRLLFADIILEKGVSASTQLQPRDMTWRDDNART